ncbi:unnamed protein product [Polarella glacialis]|uniref:UDP-glycosyltransferases domain-containing protein n=1 Tax=Polarella glacialis TaxID=89957 RepID=A0A813DKJ1_POLGL|nr:unnamed protein product [Polarella glacialis]
MCLKMCYYSLPAGICLAQRLLSAWRPDLVLHSAQEVYPQLAAAKLRVPCASFLTWPGPGVPLQMASIPEAERQAWDEALAKHPGIVPANEIAREHFGVDVLATQLSCRHFNRQLNLVFSEPRLGAEVPAYQQALLDDSTFLWVGHTGSPQHHITGVPAATSLAPWSELDQDDQPWLVPTGTKVILVTLGTLIVDMRWEMAIHVSSSGKFTGRAFCERLWEELVEQFGDRSDVRVILGVGPRQDVVGSLGDMPKNFAARRFISQVDALEHSDVFITHGGANSVKEALAAGVPMIVVPFCVDQHSNGQAVERAGAGVVFPQLMEAKRGAVAAAVAAALCGPTADSQRRRSRALGLELKRGGGAEAAAEACLRLIQKQEGKEQDPEDSDASGWNWRCLT